ncbi:glycosyl hydrolase family 43 protein [Xylogone sp. PMI_703]|nr:glycosyl hydrolase family 43 protein [Xylogone sp. PMI_703]
MHVLSAFSLALLSFLSYTSTVESHVAPSHKSFNNPVIYTDYADNDVFLGPDDRKFYFMASNMQYSPGAPILRSWDLVNWEPIAHAVPFLDFGAKYNMTDGQTAYNGGTWASTMRYRKSNGLWYWIGCFAHGTQSYVYIAHEVTGPWKLSGTIDVCYYDCGLLIDNDDTMYIVYGNTNIRIAQLSHDGLSQVKMQPVFNAPPPYSVIEGNRLYKRNDIWSGWTHIVLQDSIAGPITGGTVNSQGSLVETASGDWYFMSFTWAYPAGCMPILAPITWGSDGWPNLTTVDGAWGASINNGLTLWTTTVTNDIFKARNTLTHRTYGPFPTATIELDFQNMNDGDNCGLAAFRDATAWIGVVRDAHKYDLKILSGATLNESNFQQTSSLGAFTDSISISKGRVWLRGSLDVRVNGDQQGYFSYSLNGRHYRQFGGNFTMRSEWNFFQGERWGIFNYATKQLGGSIHGSSFTQE